LELSSYAALLAQVIPVIIVALIVEVRGTYEVIARQAAVKSAPAPPSKGKRQQQKPQPDTSGGYTAGHYASITLGPALHYLFIAVLIVLECAALIVASGSSGPFARAIVDPHRSVSVIAYGFIIAITVDFLAVRRILETSELIKSWQTIVLVSFVFLIGLATAFLVIQLVNGV
jgi:hypothetical protein